MKAFRRFVLFGSFAAIGTGLAICMAISANGPSDRTANSEETPPSLKAPPLHGGDLDISNSLATLPSPKPPPLHGGDLDIGKAFSFHRAPGEDHVPAAPSPATAAERALSAVPEPAGYPLAGPPVAVLPSPRLANQFVVKPEAAVAQADDARMQRAMDYVMQRMAAEGATPPPPAAIPPSSGAAPAPGATQAPAATPSPPPNVRQELSAKSSRPIVKADP